MKSFFIPAVSTVALAFAAPAMAQTAPDLAHPSYYGSIGDSYLTPGYNGGIDEITGRLGARLGQSWGVEGEIGAGISANQAGSAAGSRYTTEPVVGAGYLVGYLPIAPRIDLLGRVGYGASSFNQTVNGVRSSSVTNSVNFGVGAQYWLTSVDAVRADYTRRDYLGTSAIPSGGDVWGVSWVRKF